MMERRIQHTIGSVGVLAVLGIQAALLGPPPAFQSRPDDQSEAVAASPTDVSLCALVADSSEFLEQRVRVHGVLVDYYGRQSAYMYPRSECSSLAQRPPVSLIDDSAGARPSLTKEITAQTGVRMGLLERRILVVAVGRMQANPYGFAIERLERIERLPPDEPWPWPVEKCSH